MKQILSLIIDLNFMFLHFFIKEDVINYEINFFENTRMCNKMRKTYENGH